MECSRKSHKKRELGSLGPWEQGLVICRLQQVVLRRPALPSSSTDEIHFGRSGGGESRRYKRTI